eukprot:SAG22_NODE_19715_length_272_cov_0.739884_1_plen_46_part_10
MLRADVPIAELVGGGEVGEVVCVWLSACQKRRRVRVRGSDNKSYSM